MTTVRRLFAEEIFLKGEPISSQGGGGGNSIYITNITNNILTINALIAGLTGGQTPIRQPEPLIQIRPPGPHDDINENWHIGSIWVFGAGNTAYVCMDNAELHAVWKIASLEIADDAPGSSTTYSSHKIVDEFKTMLNATDYKLSLKANTSDVNTLLSGKASIASLIAGLNSKASVKDVVSLTNALDATNFVVGANKTAIAATNLDLSTYKITLASNLNNMILLIEKNKIDIAATNLDLSTYKITLASNLNNMILLIEKK